MKAQVFWHLMRVYIGVIACGGVHTGMCVLYVTQSHTLSNTIAEVGVRL